MSRELHISDLRLAESDGWTKLIVNLEWRGEFDNIQRPFNENTMWIAVENKNAYMLASDVYDAFVLIPLYLAMYYKADLYIHGSVSKKLYKNIMNYMQRILCDFSDDLSRADVHVDGFKEADGEQYIIGSSFSCGVDSLSTIYDRYVNESDPDYRINMLLFFNVGWQGDYYNPDSEKLFFARYELNKPAADELGLDVCLVNTNFHAFMYAIYANNYPGSHMGYFACYSCVLGLGRAVKKYYVSSGRSYEGIKIFSHYEQHDKDLAGFAESYLVPLIETERLEFIIDGCQYDRTQKTEIIADWNIAQKYLNVCTAKADSMIDNAHNCSKCAKCVRTLLTLEAMGKLEAFSGVFDLAEYEKVSFMSKCKLVLNRNKGYHFNDVYNYALKHNMPLPPESQARKYLYPPQKFSLRVKKLLCRIMGDKFYDALKNLVKR